MLDALWDQGLRPDSHHLKSVGFIQVTTDYGRPRTELIITETGEMQRRVHALGVGRLAHEDDSLLDDVTAGVAALIGKGKEDEDDDEKVPKAERHTTVVAADTSLYPNTTLGSLLAAVRVQAPVDDDDKDGAIDQRAVDEDFTPPMQVAAGLTIAVPEGDAYPAAAVMQHGDAATGAAAATSDSPQRRLAAGRWTRVEYGGEGCKVQLMAIQQFNTLSKEAVEKAKAAEHAAVAANRTLELFAHERMGLRDAYFVDKGHWRTELLARGKRLFHAFAEQVFAVGVDEAVEPQHIAVEVEEEGSAAEEAQGPPSASAEEEGVAEAGSGEAAVEGADE